MGYSYRVQETADSVHWCLLRVGELRTQPATVGSWYILATICLSLCPFIQWKFPLKTGHRWSERKAYIFPCSKLYVIRIVYNILRHGWLWGNAPPKIPIPEWFPSSQGYQSHVLTCFLSSYTHLFSVMLKKSRVHDVFKAYGFSL